MWFSWPFLKYSFFFFLSSTLIAATSPYSSNKSLLAYVGFITRGQSENSPGKDVHGSLFLTRKSYWGKEESVNLTGDGWYSCMETSNAYCIYSFKCIKPIEHQLKNIGIPHSTWILQFLVILFQEVFMYSFCAIIILVHMLLFGQKFVRETLLRSFSYFLSFGGRMF